MKKFLLGCGFTYLLLYSIGATYIISNISKKGRCNNV